MRCTRASQVILDQDCPRKLVRFFEAETIPFCSGSAQPTNSKKDDKKYQTFKDNKRVDKKEVKSLNIRNQQLRSFLVQKSN